VSYSAESSAATPRSSSHSFLITGMRIQFIVTKWDPNILFCASNMLLVSVMSGKSPLPKQNHSTNDYRRARTMLFMF
jgi:hypothetical protein